MSTGTRSRSRTPAAPRRFADPAIVLSGGPRHRWWYWAADWDRMRALPSAPADVTGYQRTQRVEAHPDGENTGVVWQWEADTAPGRQGRRARR